MIHSDIIRDKLRSSIIPIIMLETDDNYETRKRDILSNDRMPMWISAFTDGTLSDTTSYESLETYGDTIADAFIVRELMRWKPLIRPNEITNAKNYYVSNKFHDELISKFTYVYNGTKTDIFDPANGLFMIDREGGFQVTPSIRGDVYESILGVIAKAGDSMYLGLGQIYAYRWFYHIFTEGGTKRVDSKGKIVFEEKNLKPNPFVIMGTLFSGFGYYHKGKIDIIIEGTVVRDQTSTVTKYKTEVTLPKETIAFLKSLSSDVFPGSVNPIIGASVKNNIIIGTTVRNTMAESETAASTEALLYLENTWGITPEVLASIKKKLDEQTLKRESSLANSLDIIERHMKQMGWVSFEFDPMTKHKIEGNKMAYRLVMIDERGKRVVAKAALFNEGLAFEARKQLIELYARDLKELK